MSTAKWRNFTRQEIESYVKESKSFATLAEKLGYAKRSGNCNKIMQDMVKELNLDISHFTGQAWNKNNFDYARFKKDNAIKAAHALNALIALRGHRCENCNNITWLNKPIPLEIHHKDGDSLNNELDNLQLLCPNCHALTDNYRGRNINNGTKKVSDDEFAQTLKDSKNIRQALKKLGLTAKGDNYRRAREIIFKYNITNFMHEHQEGNLLSECLLNGEYSENAVLTN
jgi:5-methylcytosine-specific restriction endonuclease McrA